MLIRLVGSLLLLLSVSASIASAQAAADGFCPSRSLPDNIFDPHCAELAEALREPVPAKLLRLAPGIGVLGPGWSQIDFRVTGSESESTVLLVTYGAPKGPGSILRSLVSHQACKNRHGHRRSKPWT